MKLSLQFRFCIITVILLASAQMYGQKRWPGSVLYALQLNSFTNKFVVDPVVRIYKGEFSYPVPTPPEAFEGEDAEQKIRGYVERFRKEEYKKGRQLEMFIGGNKCGSATLAEIDTLHSCSLVISETTLSYIDSGALHFSDYGLAISHLSPKKLPKFQLTDSMIAVIKEYGKNEFLKRGVKSDLVEKMEMTNVRAADVDGDGKPEYLVSYEVTGETVKHGDDDENIRYSLTLILKPSSNGFTQLYTHYPDPALPEDTHIYKFIDVIDLDGDGNAEIVIQQLYPSGWDYILLQKKGSTWDAVYEGAGGGC